MKKIQTILVVDDENNTCFGLKTLLSREGYQVECVGNGHEGLQFLRENGAQLVISDIRMPMMDGLSFLQRIKEDYPHISVILMTAFGCLDSYIDAMNKGAFEYLIKPLKIHELKKVIHKLEGDGILPFSEGGDHLEGAEK